MRLLLPPYSECTIRGPYVHRKGRKKDIGRRYVHCVFPDGRIKNVPYARYLMEVYLGKYIPPEYDVHHKDGDRTNDMVSNFEVKPKSDHTRDHHKKFFDSEFVCPTCKNTFVLTGRQIYLRARDRRRGRSMGGPYCSLSCVAKRKREVKL